MMSFEISNVSPTIRMNWLEIRRKEIKSYPTNVTAIQSWNRKKIAPGFPNNFDVAMRYL